MGLFQRSAKVTDSVTPDSIPHVSSNFKFASIRRRSAVELLGTVAVIIIVALIGVSMHMTNDNSKPTNKAATSKNSSLNVQVSHSTANPPSSTPASPPSNSMAGTSTNISSSTANGSTHMQVTVNGQDIPVPTNGSVDQTVPTPGGGTTSFSATNTQSGNDSSYNFSHSSVTTNSSSSDSSFSDNVTNSNSGGGQ